MDADEEDRSGWVEDGLWTFPVAFGVLVTFLVVELVASPSPIRPAPWWLRFVAVVVVIVLVGLARVLVAQVLRRRQLLVSPRRRAATWVGAAYLPVAGALVALDLDAYQLAVAAGALAMTSPGVLLVVLDGSPPLRAVLRVLLAVAMTPIAAVVGYVVGFLAFFVSTMIGSFLFGVLAGHLVTFVPLAVVGPGPSAALRVRDRP